jgi:IstB-like ATP binding protein
MHTGLPVESPVLSNGHAGFGGAGQRNGSPETATPRPGPTLHLPLQAEGAAALFQVIAQRYLKGSIALTTNRGIASWGQIFDDPMVAAAMLDRLLHRSTVLHIDGESYRMRAHRARVEGIRKGVAPTKRG